MPARMNSRNGLLTAAIATAALLALPALSQAAYNFGSRMNHEPANTGECKALPTPCTLAQFTVPSDPNGDPYSGGAPADGVITKFRIRAFSTTVDPNVTVTFRLANVTRPNPADSSVAIATAAGTGPTVSFVDQGAPDTPIREFPARLSVKKGNQLAIDGTNVGATVNDSGEEFTYRYDPPLVEGQGPRGSNQATGELLVAATVEPDADNDGFGDETQDQCPRQATTQGACDDAKPVITGLAFKPGKFGPLSTGNSIAKKKKKKKRAPLGSTVSYNLSEAANVVFTVQRKQLGRKKGSKCITTRKRGKRCTTLKSVTGSFNQAGKAGANSFKFTGRLNGRKLKRATYSLIATATDVAGNVGAPVRKDFRIAK